MKKTLKYTKIDTRLSQKSTILSAMRTLLSYIRTSLVCISVAFAFIKLDKQHPLDAITILLFVFSAGFLIAGIIDFCLSKKMIDSIKVNIKNEE